MQRKTVAPFTSRLRAESTSAEAGSYARSDVSDELLMVRYQRGDRAAFATLIKRYQRAVFNYLLRQVRDATVADSLAQDTFLRVVQRASEFKHEARFRSWLFGLVRQTRAEHLGQQATHRARSSEPGAAPNLAAFGAGTPAAGAGAGGTHAPSATITPVDHQHNSGTRAIVDSERAPRSSSAARLAECVVRAVDELPPEQQEVFLLRELGQLNFKEMAEVLGSTEAQVQQRLRQALERLQQALSGLEEYARALK